MQFVLDGANFGNALTVPPYQVFWNTLTAANGAHTVRAKAIDAGNNQTITPVANVTVSNSTTTPLTASLLVGLTSGNAPLTTSLTGQAQGSATGTYNFTFYCNNPDPSLPSRPPMTSR